MLSADTISKIIKFVQEDAALHEIFTVIGTLLAILLGLSFFLKKNSAGQWLPCKTNARSKYLCEVWFLSYGAVWITAMMTIIVFQLYTSFDRIHYAVVLGVLVAPLYLQPVVLPSLTGDEGLRLLDRYSFKANLWLAIFGFIGNYWYEV
jgi:hypothetical protein